MASSTPLEPWGAQDRASASRLNQLVDIANAVKNCTGNIKFENGALSVPEKGTFKPSQLPHVSIKAGADDGTSTYGVGQVVVVVDAVDIYDFWKKQDGIIARVDTADGGATTSTLNKVYGVVTEPIRATLPGKIAISGICLARVKHEGTGTGYANLADYGNLFLEDGDLFFTLKWGTGRAKLIWEESATVTDEHWGLVQLQDTRIMELAKAQSDPSSGVLSVKWISVSAAGAVTEHGSAFDVRVVVP